MKKWLGLCLAGWMLIAVPDVYAHNELQNFLQIDGEFVIHNSIQGKSIENFDLAHELAPKNYIVLQPINFKIDTFKLNKTPDWIQKAKFKLDFGDGKEEEKLQAVHTYQKTGTYKGAVWGQSGEGEMQILTTFEIQILPLKNYRLPEPIITIDSLADYSVATVEAKFDNEINLSAKNSGQGSTKIVDLSWDLGDGTFSKEQSLVHRYDTKHYGTIVILRAVDVNGFHKDTFVQLVNKDPVKVEEKKTVVSGNILIWGGGLMGILILGLIAYKLRFRLLPKK